MKLEAIDPKLTPWREGQSRKVSTWRFFDRLGVDDSRSAQREVWHYSTLMGVFAYESGEWRFYPVSTGWGSVSDQSGINKITKGYGFRYVRKGGARYVATNNNNEGN